MKRLLKLLRPKKLIKLAQEQAEFEAQADAFLSDNGFPVDANHRRMYGMFVQSSDPEKDILDGDKLIASIRKAKASMMAFWLIHPDKKPKEEVKDVGPESGTESPVQDMEQEA